MDQKLKTGKIILIVTIVSTFLLLSINSIPAIEYKICLTESESQNFNKLENRELSIVEKSEKLKNINLIEILIAIRNIDIDVLKGNILQDIKNSDLTFKEKLYVEKLLSSQKFINIFLKGIIIPIIFYTFAYRNIKIIPNIFGLLSVFIIGWFVPQFYIFPAAKDIKTNTGIPWLVSGLLLLIIDNILGYYISNIFVSI